MNDIELIDGYLRYYRVSQTRDKGAKEACWKYWVAVDTRRDPNDLPFIFELINACEDDAEIAYVAAGPLKTLLYEHHLEIKEALSILVRKHSRMRKAIQAIIFSPGTAERKTLDDILNTYGLKHASL